MSRTFMLVLGVCLAQGMLTASQAHAWWCNGYLVLPGDAAAHVEAVCGPPTMVSYETETTTTTTGSERLGWVHQTRTVTIEIWTYDFGPGRFMESVVIASGVVRGTRRHGPGTRRETR